MNNSTPGKLRSVVVGLGSYLPKRIVSNVDLEKSLDTTDEWIVQRTGIKQRHVAAEDEPTSVLGFNAARAALADAGLTGSDLDLVIVATATPDYTFPAVATQIQASLGMFHGAAFDMQAVCSGFVYALATADKFLISGSHKRALVIGAETFSRLLDWKDRTTCVLFGDGAGAIVLEAQHSSGSADDRGVLTSHLRSDGRHREKLYVDGGPSSTKTTGHLRMAGREVFRHAVGMVADVVTEAFAATGTTAQQLDWFVPHQANRRIIDASAEKLGIAAEKVVVTVDLHGNTSAASIPLALTVARDDGRIKKGDLVMIEAMGGGFTWASALIRW
ncbi:3-oxoacyl-[acyl-carrier-protein] synthase-3 [Methylocapsa palsarum]|uniref:Beta-ketoacyl-[acyl-carrier-protein] synthase III n=1 Tax=Methylocapsa palsarum TaxID=1612308 RepID=A0A1I3Y7B5_9HYPH|nr:3-oxoacyl-[acyl-carrier-protein] synthase-3 [Methylocapsa palsarum]